MLKTCIDCKGVWPIEEFPLSGGKGKRSSRCRPCKQKYDRNWYQKNKDSTNARRKITRPATRRNSYLLVLEYLKANPCMTCGEKDPVVLEFDHRDPKVKLYNVSEMIVRHHSVSSIMEEIAKCDVLCANCHRRKTAKQFGWYAYAQ